MTQSRQPKVTIPPRIKGEEKDSFAFYTLSDRLPSLCRRIIAENEFPPGIVENLENLAEEMPNNPVRSLSNSQTPDFADWETYLEPYRGKTWLEIPWYVAEAYFYRRVLETTGYFQPLSEGYGIDPYTVQKQRGLESALDSIPSLSAKLNEMKGEWDEKSFVFFVYFALWGNRIDLSLWPAEEGDRIFIEAEHQQENLLVDDAQKVADYLRGKTGIRSDFIVDNSGFELLCDLCLADFLLTAEIAGEVRFHVKAHPTFVSDAMSKDVRETVQTLAGNADPEVRAFGDRLQNYLDSDRILLVEDYFWSSPLVFWEMPERLRQELGRSQFIVVKGDANYRRILGDRHWDFTTAFADIACYFPAPVLALRTMKAELACGLKASQIEKLNREDPEWLTDGKRGVIQFSVPPE